MDHTDKQVAFVRNRVFELNFDHGKEFIAKIPFPSAGPKHYRTPSEVATLDYLRTCHGIPVPTVRAWCSRAESSPVGTEYVMYEKLQGIGSLYYKGDVDESLRCRPLYKVDLHPTMGSGRFRVGPTVGREFWRAGRAALDIDREPSCRARHALIHASSARVCPGIYRLLPASGPLDPGDLLRPYTLWHPDLHVSNIIVTESADSCSVVGSIDWQGAVIAPDHSQLKVPAVYEAEDHPLIDHPDGAGMPSICPEADAREGEEKHAVQLAFRWLKRKKMHELPARRIVTLPGQLITRGLEEGLAAIEKSFLVVRALWNMVAEVDESGVQVVDFPVEISEERAKDIENDLQQHQRVEEGDG
ncbi:hypothetical protein BN946_scf184920.g19 [Trametes cinnabarina]|uniref:Aminoglycoside phosphotransferase domain-containing protein n=1 Tax=Pycnoporus cinnabarinus TaxID=5643 RepID=A0A060SBK7_PYCCI|nr:hypothetical protein BN946_scf184920.g19 [Trametes cinnabarina]